MHYILCKEKSVNALKEEIQGTLTKKVTVEKGLPLLSIPDSVNLKGEYIAFSTTALINAKKVAEDSISKQAAQIVAMITEVIPQGAKINCHLYSITHKYGVIETGRAEILKDKVRSLLKKERIFPLRKNFDRSIGFVQAIVLADRSLAVSVLTAHEMEMYHSLVSPYVGGFNYGQEDKNAPSRAFRKIVEAQDIMGVQIGENEQLIDLGACPGGWSYVARQQGARVIALDRSPLREDLMADEMVEFVKADAFKYIPEVAIDWAVSDIISTPDRVMELVEYWVLGNNCKHFIFTIKFHGDENYDVVNQFKTVAKKCTFNVIIKQLNANKNEVTIMGSQQ